MPAATREQSSDCQRACPKWWHVLLVLVAGFIVYVLGLGRAGLAATEGHRVIPAWEMMGRGDWWVPRMFGQVYLRKPPGMQWAVGVSSSVLGETEFAARVVSAAAMVGLALVVMWFAARWFGRGGGVAAGLASVLTPLFWTSGRVAELEALNNFAAAVAVLVVLDGLVGRGKEEKREERRENGGGGAGRGWYGRFGWGVVAGLAIVLAGVVKGPAAGPAIGAAVVAAAVVRRSWRVVLAPGLWIAIGIAGLVLGLVFWRVREAVMASGEAPVLQGVSDFLWTGRALTAASVGAVLVMPLLVVLSVLPWALGMVFPWGRDAWAEVGRVREGGGGVGGKEGSPRRPGIEALRHQGIEVQGRAGDAVKALEMARAVVLTCVVALVILAVIGVRNPRYGQPCVAFVPVIAGYMAWGWRGGFGPLRRKIARVMMLGHPLVLLGVLAAAALVYAHAPGPWRSAEYSGKRAGLEMGAVLEGGEVWADHLVEARPEVLLYAQRAAQERGERVSVRWIPGLAERPRLPGAGSYVVLRQDANTDEVGAFAAAGLMERLEAVGAGSVRQYQFTVYRVR